MPSIPRSQCDQYQCKAAAIAGSRFCEQHTPQRAAPKTARREQDSLYRSRVWQQIRTAQLTAHPLCQCCQHEGRLTAAEVVDHVFRWKDYGEQAFRLNLWSSLCSPCHSRKGRQEQRGVFRHYTDEGFRDYKASDWPAAVIQS
jgi:5-methylcytosine-specific restriction protein A